MSSLAPGAGINPYIVVGCIRYFLVGKEIKNNMWSGFAGGYEIKDTDVMETAIRELIEESCNVFLPWNSDLIRRLRTQDKCTLIKSKSPRGRDIYSWFVEFPPSIKDMALETQFKENRSKTYDPHYMEKERIAWVSEKDIFNYRLGKGFQKDLKRFLG